ncbi:Glycosyltransferase involved in cell wall bisynthesis [Actinomyces ruminicola]|uniref:Glycosyltransferase involved in cell wall bisynthesis n=1 Tax=Actinomyces ruminicola TaxID=332524 RepID=A0A1H0EX61_9ACTO|nr:glycosyltransferase family 4 protein [Actinomyces ruminicola]SDN86968.1 Glycosyltransferase involved in cell wall bisynthesis [Actinomyces ruminicola]
MTTAAVSRPDSPLALVAHPSPDLYGSDWQLAETITGLLGAGYRVNVALPANGPLVGVLEGAGARVAVVPFTVLRKSLLTPRGLAGLAARATGEFARLRRLIKACRADLLLANTVTIPWWPLAGRAAGIPVLSHVHEAEDTQHLLVRAGLNAPLLAATRIVANSEAARRALLSAQPLLAGRTRVVHNGVAAPPQLPAPLRERDTDAPFRIAMVGRLSPRKGVDVLLEAVALLRDRGVNASLEVAGSIFPGYEWYEAELRQRAAAPDLAGHVDFLGYVHPTWPVLDGADAVVVPSRQEPFGNTAVEAMHAARPLVASSAQGLKEVVDDGVTGLLVPPDDPRALADALGRLAADPALAARLARQGAEAAQQRFSVQGYRAAMCAVVGDLLAA